MKKLLSAAIVAGALLTGSSASAATITFNLNDSYGDDEPSGLLTATLEDVVGGVLVTMDASALTPVEFVTNWVFNFTGDASELIATYQSGATADSIGLENQTFDITPSKFY